jgi:hypothetical protein
MTKKQINHSSKGQWIFFLSITLLPMLLFSMCSKSGISVGKQKAYDECVDEKMKVLKLNIIDADGACDYWKHDHGSSVNK